MIPIINEVFSEHFSDTADVVLLANEQLSLPEDGKQTKRITDSNIIVSEEIESYRKNAADVFDELLGQARDRFEISANHRKRHYIIECESKDFYDRCVIRIAEYVFKSALDKDAHLENGEYVIVIPHAAVISLRGPSADKDFVSLVIRGDEGETRTKVHIMRLADYDIETIFEKKLYALIPFLPFRYEKDFPSMADDDERLNAMLDEMKSVCERVSALVPDNEETFSLINAFEENEIRVMLVKVFNGLAVKYPKIREGVEKTVGGNIIEFEALRIKREGILEGERNGERKGRFEESLRMSLNMIRAGLSGNAIMEISGKSRQEIDELAKNNGFAVDWEEKTAAN